MSDFPAYPALASGQLLIGNASNIAQARALSGDVTVDNAGVTTIGAGKVTDAMHVANSLSAALPNLSTFFGAPVASSASTQTATANQTYYVGVVVPWKATLTGVSYVCIATGSGNVRSSLYNSAGTRVANRTTNVACVALTLQQIAFDSTYLAVPGLYFVAMTFSSGTSTFSTMTHLTPSGNAAGAGSGATATSITPPTAPVGGQPAMATY